MYNSIAIPTFVADQCSTLVVSIYKDVDLVLYVNNVHYNYVIYLGSL